MTITENAQDKYLAQMLEGFEKGLEGITNFIEENEQQLTEARNRREEIIESIAELKGLLGISEEEAE
jgi:chorismate mutase